MINLLVLVAYWRCGTMPQDPAEFSKVSMGSPMPVEKRVASWKSALRNLFKGVVANVLIDVGGTDISASPIRGSKPDDQAESLFLKLVSSELHRKLTKVTDGWAFERGLGYSATTLDTYRRATSWLISEDEIELQKLCTTGVAYADLSENTKEMFSRMCDNPGLQEKMASGDFAAAAVRVVPVVSAYDNNGKLKTFPADLTVRSDYEQSLRDKLESTYLHPKPTHQAVDKPTGPLDLSQGDLLSLEAISELYTRKFNKTLHYDGRLGKTYYYVQGRFTETNFLEALKAVAKAIPTDLNTESVEDLKARLNELLKKKLAAMIDPATLSKGLSMGDLTGDKQFSAKDLSEILPFLDRSLALQNISPDSALTLSAGLSLQLMASGGYLEPDAPKGSSPLGNGWAFLFTKT